MTLSAGILRYRIQLKKALQTPDSIGGFSRSYETLVSLWAGVEQITPGQYIRGVQAGVNITHNIIIRSNSLDSLFGEFSKAFNSAFKNVDIHPLKSEFFIFIPVKSDTEGNMLRVRKLIESGFHNSWITIMCEQIEQVGVGWYNG
jgi:hypothetical protein